MAREFRIVDDDLCNRIRIRAHHLILREGASGIFASKNTKQNKIKTKTNKQTNRNKTNKNKQTKQNKTKKST